MPSRPLLPRPTGPSAVARGLRLAVVLALTLGVCGLGRAGAQDGLPSQAPAQPLPADGGSTDAPWADLGLPAELPTPARPELQAPAKRFDPLEAARPRLEVRRGWARVIRGEQLELLTPDSPPFEIEARAYLELGAVSSARLIWPGGAQAEFLGTTGLELEPLDGSAGRAWTWRFRRLTTVEVDVRRGSHSLVLPRAQALMPSRALFRLEGSVGGAVRLFHRAGERIELDLGGRYTFLVPVGANRPVPERLDPLPATYRGRGQQ